MLLRSSRDAESPVGIEASMARMMVSLVVIEFAPMTALSVTAGAVAEEGLGLNAALAAVTYLGS